MVERDGEHIARAEIAGDFPGSPVTLAFHFTFGDDGLIHRLAIRAQGGADLGRVTSEA